MKRKFLKKVKYRECLTTRQIYNLKNEVIEKVDDYLDHILSDFKEYEQKLKRKKNAKDKTTH
jgi:hypothetical protein|tara:strand:+ start:45 stop:230 length:186 start_codon:yes stop_codon:yes gene_type:complete